MKNESTSENLTKSGGRKKKSAVASAECQIFIITWSNKKFGSKNVSVVNLMAVK